MGTNSTIQNARRGVATIIYKQNQFEQKEVLIKRINGIFDIDCSCDSVL